MGVTRRRAGQMSYPFDVAIGPDHCLYVCEYGNHRVQKFDLEGESLGGGGAPGEGLGSSSIPTRWRLTAREMCRSSIPTIIEFNVFGCEGRLWFARDS